MRRIILFIFLWLLAAAAPAGAQNTGERLARPSGGPKIGVATSRSEQVFRAIYPRAPASLDPHARPDPAAWPIIMATYNRLMSFEGGTAKPTYSLVKTMAVSPDGLNYTFQLQEGQTFSDGTLVNAKAAYFSFDRLMASEVGRLYYPYLKSFKAEGPYSFTLILKRPWPPFLASLALPQASLISPGLRNKPDGFLNDRTLGSGRYLVYDWRDNTIGLTARPDQATKPNLAFAMFHYEPDPKNRYDKMVAHEAHLTVDPLLPAEGLPAQFRLKQIPTFGARFLAFNTRQPYTRVQNTRRALSIIIGQAYKNHPEAMSGLFPRGLFYNAPASATRPVVGQADPLAQAAVILKDVGLPAGPLTLAVQGRGGDLNADARKISETLEAHGFRINIVNLDGQDGRQILNSGAYDLYLGTRFPDIPAADMWLGRFLSSQSSAEGNPALLRNGQADRMILDIMDTVGQPGDGPHDYYLRGIAQARAAKLADLAALAEIEAAYVFLYQVDEPLVLDARLVPQTERDPLPHPAWPEVWPIDETIIRPFSFRSGANPTGRKPDSPASPEKATEPVKPPVTFNPAASPDPPPVAPAPVTPEAGPVTPPARPGLKPPESRPVGPNPNPDFDDFIGSEMD